MERGEGLKNVEMCRCNVGMYQYAILLVIYKVKQPTTCTSVFCF